MAIAYLALGSNIEPEKNILEAVKLLSRSVRVLKSSTVYLTKPLLGKRQSDYFDCVVKIETTIGPQELKSRVLRAVEEKLGRRRSADRYASRTIDIDLILYGNLQISTRELTIPDPEIEHKAFLALPLCEVEPNLTLPPVDKSIQEVADKFANEEMVPLKDFTDTLRELIRRQLAQ